eukprot:CAMPEP_0201116542 /NCGR_PEP_ID=MMETSP0850-20130426/787_1 /ASSEMBLY_ACC=CAM_ASM_000622 /TAXON_ID=183588 /ORGANISM="Pseudo-nitzschia fraudulenta, Strain WWA7" /LENGTH=324 /DNA_ID=CAMNT_0047380643 /DNA_START=323 /DNA_END=1297 /DNA_ORIENTATION=-
MSIAGASTLPTTTECAVVGVGVLGTSLCKQLLRDPDFKDLKVTGITKSKKRHDDILKEVLGEDDQYSERFELRTVDENIDQDNKKFNHCVFCAPPSGFDDYPSAVKAAIDDLWMGQNDENNGGAFVFTSSGGIYGSGGDDVDVSPIVTESSPLPSDATPRIKRLVDAETEVLKKKGGSVMRLAGLYLLNRGAHNYWLGDTVESMREEIAGRSDSMVNLLHYDDAAGSVVAALKKTVKTNESGDNKLDDSEGGEVFLVSDGHPLTRRQICESSLKNKRYSDRKIPNFTGSKEKGDPIGKIYDGSYTNNVLDWKPTYESFDKFMSS